MKISDIQIPPRFRKEFGDIECLAKSIKELGLLQIPLIDANYRLVAGYRRILACQYLGHSHIPVSIVNLKDIVKGEIHENTVRENFTWEEIMQIKAAIEPELKEDALKREKGGKTIEPSSNLDEGRTDEKLAKYLSQTGPKMGKDKLRDVSFVYELREKFPLVWKSVNEDVMKPHKARNIIKEQLRIETAREKSREFAKKGENLRYNNFDLLLGDMRDLRKAIRIESIDLMLTDPPYAKNGLDIYDHLAVFGDPVLKPGGSLVTIVPHFAIRDVIERIEKCSDLKYHWPLAIKHNGHKKRVHAYRVWAGYKPLLWFYKGEKPTQYHDIQDLIESEPVDKALHPWRQSTIEAKHVIEALTVEYDRVCDPFCGTGTNLIAALECNRLGIGIEIIEDVYNIAKGELIKKAKELELEPCDSPNQDGSADSTDKEADDEGII